MADQPLTTAIGLQNAVDNWPITELLSEQANELVQLARASAEVRQSLQQVIEWHGTGMGRRAEGLTELVEAIYEKAKDPTTGPFIPNDESGPSLLKKGAVFQQDPRLNESRYALNANADAYALRVGIEAFAAYREQNQTPLTHDLAQFELQQSRFDPAQSGVLHAIASHIARVAGARSQKVTLDTANIPALARDARVPALMFPSLAARGATFRGFIEAFDSFITHRNNATGSKSMWSDAAKVGDDLDRHGLAIYYRLKRDGFDTSQRIESVVSALDSKSNGDAGVPYGQQLLQRIQTSLAGHRTAPPPADHPNLWSAVPASNAGEFLKRFCNGRKTTLYEPPANSYMQDLLRERSVGGAKPVNALADRLFVVGAQLGGLQQAEEIVMAAAKELVAESGLSLEEFDLDELEYEEELMLKRAFGRGSNDPVNPFTAGPVTPGL